MPSSGKAGAIKKAVNNGAVLKQAVISRVAAIVSRMIQGCDWTGQDAALQLRYRAYGQACRMVGQFSIWTGQPPRFQIFGIRSPIVRQFRMSGHEVGMLLLPFVGGRWPELSVHTIPRIEGQDSG